MAVCAACESLDGKGPGTRPHPRLELIRRARPAGGAQLHFRCKSCEAEIAWFTQPGEGWQLYFTQEGHRRHSVLTASKPAAAQLV